MQRFWRRTWDNTVLDAHQLFLICITLSKNFAPVFQKRYFSNKYSSYVTRKVCLLVWGTKHCDKCDRCKCWSNGWIIVLWTAYITFILWIFSRWWKCLYTFIEMLISRHSSLWISLGIQKPTLKSVKKVCTVDYLYAEAVHLIKFDSQLECKTHFKCAISVSKKKHLSQYKGNITLNTSWIHFFG